MKIIWLKLLESFQGCENLWGFAPEEKGSREGREPASCITLSGKIPSTEQQLRGWEAEPKATNSFMGLGDKNWSFCVYEEKRP